MANAELTGVQKAAVLLITLGPEKSASIFKHLKEEEIEELTLEIANTRSISPQEKEDVLKKSRGICAHCGKPIYIGYQFSVDHYIPLTKGGVNRSYNLCLLYTSPSPRD